MKPFITPDVSATGKKGLRFQCENIAPESISGYLQDLEVVAYSMPIGHSFQMAWIFRLLLSNGSSLEFSSACTMVAGWQEVGSLNIQLVNRDSAERPEVHAVLVRVDVLPLRIISVTKLVYQDPRFFSECGISIEGANNEEIVIATAMAPGSVSVAAPFSTAPFASEFPISECERKPL